MWAKKKIKARKNILHHKKIDAILYYEQNILY